MNRRTLRAASLALAAVLFLAPAALAGGEVTWQGASLWSKRGLSGQVYSWQTGSC
jgi:hypothetical protein